MSKEIQGNGKTVALRLTDRGLYERAKELYGNNLVFIREILQNAVDSGAKNLDIEIDNDGRKIRLSDDGSGMSKSFLINQFKIVGNRFKTDESKRGSFGVGRLSLWMPIVHEDSLGNVGYSGKVNIVTSDGTAKTELDWESLPTYTVHDRGPTKEHGTSITIESDRNLTFTKNQIEDYIKDVAVKLDIDIKVNGNKIQNKYVAEMPAYNGSRRFLNSAVHSRIMPKYQYSIYPSSATHKLAVAEKGILAQEIDSPTMGGVINFTKGRHKGEGIGIMPLSRDRMLLNANQVLYEFMVRGVAKYDYLDNKDAIRSTAWIMEHMPKHSRRGVAAVNALKKMITIDGEKLYDLERRGNVFWYDRNDYYSTHVVREFRNMVDSIGKNRYGNYKLLAIDDDYLVKILKTSRIPRIQKLERKISKGHSIETRRNKRKQAIKQLRGYLLLIADAAKPENHPISKIAKKVANGSKLVGMEFAKGFVVLGTGIAAAGIGIGSFPLVIAKKVKNKAADLKDKSNRPKSQPRNQPKRKAYNRKGGLSVTFGAAFDMLSYLSFGIKSKLIRTRKIEHADEISKDNAPHELIRKSPRQIILGVYNSMKEYVIQARNENRIISAQKNKLKEKKAVEKEVERKFLAEKRQQRKAEQKEAIINFAKDRYNGIFRWIEEQKNIKEREKERKVSEKLDRKAQKFSKKAVEDYSTINKIRNFIINGREADSKQSEKVSVGGIKLVIKEVEDKDVVAKSEKGRIILNQENDFVKEQIENGRTDLLLPVIIHQFVNMFRYADKEEAAKTELKLMERVMEEIAKEEISLDGNLIDEQEKRYVPKIELRKEELNKLGLGGSKHGKHNTVDVTVTPVLRRNEKVAEKLKK